MFELLEKVFGSRDVYSVLNNISPEAAAHPKKRNSISIMLYELKVKVYSSCTKSRLCL